MKKAKRFLDVRWEDKGFIPKTVVVKGVTPHPVLLKKIVEYRLTGRRP